MEEGDRATKRELADVQLILSAARKLVRLGSQRKWDLHLQLQREKLFGFKPDAGTLLHCIAKVCPATASC